MSDAARLAISILAGAVVGTSGATFGIGVKVGRAETAERVAAVEARQDALDELRAQLHAAVAATLTAAEATVRAADETRRARQAMEQLGRTRTAGARGGRP